MVKVKVNASPVIKKIQDAFKNVIVKEELYLNIANFSVERVQQEARLGKRMEQNGATEKLPALLPGYVNWRKKLKPGQTTGVRGLPLESGPTDPQFFRPEISSSNLTFTGQLLKGLAAKILQRGPSVGKIELSFSGSRKEGGTNADVYSDLLKRNPGYSVLSLSKKAIERIQNICLTRLRQELIRLKLK